MQNIDPKLYDLHPRIILRKNQKNIYIVIDRKSRVIMKDGYRILEIAKKILKKSSKTIATGKKAFYEQLELGVSEAYKFTSEIMTDNMTEYNAQEGVDAFLQKRSPVWKD